jgi:triose/dihydroxyacetone kinase / FAD-AMP lyase (cyclizing)
MAKPKKILNDPSKSVDDYIDGLLCQYPNHYKKLSNHHVVLFASHMDRTTGQNNKVHILSGGGSGHEPSHAGWVGDGMLTGVICGGIFASPSITSILAAIRVVASNVRSEYKQNDTNSTTNGGILLIVKNYTGDRLNFGMAAERANQDGINTYMVVVADDCAIPRTKGITGARGVAGTVLIHKIAGAAAGTYQSLYHFIILSRRKILSSDGNTYTKIFFFGFD